MDETKILEKAYQRFDEALEATSENRERMVDDLRFSIGEQWPEEIRVAREAEYRPCFTFNKMNTSIRQIVNDQRMNRPKIKIRGVDTKGDPLTAKVLNGLIRQIEQTSNAEKAFDVAFESAVRCGLGWFRVTTEYEEGTFEQCIKIEDIENPFTVFHEPGGDLMNLNWLFVAKTMKHDEFEREYGGEDKIDFKGDGVQGIYREKWWNDNTVKVAEYWVKEPKKVTLLMLNTGEVVEEIDGLREQIDLSEEVWIENEREDTKHVVKQYIIAGETILEEIEWSSKYIPIIPVTGYVWNIEGERIFEGIVRQGRDAQNMYNFHRTTSTELISLSPKAPYIGLEGQFDGYENEWNEANRKSYPYLEYKDVPNAIGPPMRQPFDMPAMGALQEAMSASDDLKSIMGIFDAGLGDRSNEVSGKAILSRQKEGDVSNFHFIDNLKRAIEQCGRVLIDLIPTIYDTERTVRIINPENEEELVTINKMFVDETGQQRSIDLTTGKYDVVVDVGPSFTTQRQEAAEAMMEFMRVMPQAAPIIGDMLAKNMDWPEADQIAQRLKSLLPEGVDGGIPPQVMQKLQQMGQAIQALQQQNQGLQQELQQTHQGYQQQLMNKQAELAMKAQDIQAKHSEEAKRLELKEREIQQKYEKETADILMQKQELASKERQVYTKIEADTMKNVPGSVI